MRGVTEVIHRILGNSALIGVEIGVANGTHARELLNNLTLSRLYLVDPWESYMQNGVVVDHFATRYESVVRKFKKYKGVKILRKYSTAAASKIPNNLDFVYIDGNHEYAAVKEDLLCWYPKVRPGGILAGHDYYARCPDVVRAVDEFVKLHKYPLYTNKIDWWVVKNV